ncbi:MAG: MBOAT family protein [Lachnospiraceae bacterium]|nr:MBOAT family protein [Lachnospiraceae bacterium]
MMVFNSVSFAIFFPIAVLVYFILPPSKEFYRKLWLLLCSYYFYMSQGAGYALLILAVTLVSFIAAFGVHKRKGILAAALIIEFSVLFFFKYFNFFCESFSIKTGLDILLPVGISFYIFKSVSYMIDVFRGTIEPERDFLKYALYVSFFPELLAGPISRAPSVMPQFDEVHYFEYERVRHGLFRMLWGYFVKLVIASRLSILVDLVYSNVDYADGLQLFTASAVYAIQIYCDFMSYSEIALGAGEILGIRLHENFRQPFLAESLSDLWRRWHMSLMSWFKDYLYIPLGGSRKGKARKYLNILIVFTLSGLWHGAAVTFIIWGFLSGLLQVLGEITLPLRKKLIDMVPVKNAFTSAVHGLYKRVATFLLFLLTVIFFRADTLPEALTILRKIFTDITPSVIRSFDPGALGLGTVNLGIAVIMVAVLLITDILKEKTGDVFSFVTAKAWYVRWGVYFFLTLSIIFSANIGAAKFIYFDF